MKLLLMLEQLLEHLHMYSPKLLHKHILMLQKRIGSWEHTMQCCSLNPMSTLPVAGPFCGRLCELGRSICRQCLLVGLRMAHVDTLQPQQY